MTTCPSTSTPNADGQEVPAINSDGACYELELVKAQEVKSIQHACNVDQQFKNFATRVNKAGRGTASCSDVLMDKDLFIDLEDFAKAFRKEVPPGVRTNVKKTFLELPCKLIDTARAASKCYAHESHFAQCTTAFKQTKMTPSSTL